MEFKPERREMVAEAMAKHYEPGPRCWEATCYRHPSGHPMVRVPVAARAPGQGRRPQYMHRIMYEIYVGSIPPDAIVHHVCGNQGCVNPDHLTLQQRGAHTSSHQLGQRSCKYGHPWTPENTYIELRQDRDEPRHVRVCRRCKARQQRERRANRKEG